MILLYTILLTSTLFHVGSRATITRSVWSRYPLWLARFMDCAMCSGAWYGLLVAIVLQQLGYDYPGLAANHAPFVCFFGSAAWTPIGANAIQRALEQLGTRQEIVDELVERGEIEQPFDEGPRL